MKNDIENRRYVGLHQPIQISVRPVVRGMVIGFCPVSSTFITSFEPLAGLMPACEKGKRVRLCRRDAGLFAFCMHWFRMRLKGFVHSKFSQYFPLVICGLKKTSRYASRCIPISQQCALFIIRLVATFTSLNFISVRFVLTRYSEWLFWLVALCAVVDISASMKTYCIYLQGWPRRTTHHFTVRNWGLSTLQLFKSKEFLGQLNSFHVLNEISAPCSMRLIQIHSNCLYIAKPSFGNVTKDKKKFQFGMNLSSSRCTFYLIRKDILENRLVETYFITLIWK